MQLTSIQFLFPVFHIQESYHKWKKNQVLLNEYEELNETIFKSLSTRNYCPIQRYFFKIDETCEWPAIYSHMHLRMLIYN